MAEVGARAFPESDYHPAADAARLAGVSPARLRRYEQAGLLMPARRQGRIRFYSERQVAELRRIRRLNDDLGVNLAGVDVILRLLEEMRMLQASVPLPGPGRLSNGSPNHFMEHTTEEIR